MTTTNAPTRARRNKTKPETSQRQDLTLIESCARRICAVDNKTVEDVFEKGVTFAEVKALLKGESGAYGKALALAGYRDTKIPEMYIYIASDQVLTDPKTFSHLPPEYTKLHKLAQQPDTVKRRLIAERKLRRDMTLTEINALIADVRAVETKVPEVADHEVVAKVGLNAGSLGDLLSNALLTVADKDWWSPIGAVQLTLPDDGGLVLLSTDRHTLLRQEWEVVSAPHGPCALLGVAVCREWSQFLQRHSEDDCELILALDRVEAKVGDAVLVAESMAGGYPQYDKILGRARTSTTHERYGVSAQKLAVLGDIVAPGKSRRDMDLVPWTSETTAASDPALWTNRSDAWFAEFVIAPTRLAD